MNDRPSRNINPTVRAVIERRIKALCRQPRWFHPGDQEDVAQELALHAHVIAHHFDWAKGDVMRFYNTALTRRVRDLIAQASAACRDWRRSVPLGDAGSILCPARRSISLRLDVQHVLGQAPHALRRFAMELMRDDLATAARKLGLSRQQARHQRALLARHFTRYGLNPCDGAN